LDPSRFAVGLVLGVPIIGREIAAIGKNYLHLRLLRTRLKRKEHEAKSGETIDSHRLRSGCGPG